MARGEEKDTLGGRVESKVDGALVYTGLFSGGAAGIYAMKVAESMNGPESTLLNVGGLASIFGGVYLGVKAAGLSEGVVSEKVNSLIPDSRKSEELYIDDYDPLELEARWRDVRHGLTDEQYDRIDSSTQGEGVTGVGFSRFVRDNIEAGPTEEWLEDLVYGGINGLEGGFRASSFFNGDYKAGYANDADGVFVQAPKKGDTFQETLARVNTWKENADVLSKADEYLGDILSKSGKKTVPKGASQIEIDYDYISQNKEILREDIEGGIATPSESYDVVITSKNGEPFPVLVGEYNPDMLERGSVDDSEKASEVRERKKVLGMYMDALIDEGHFEGYIGDFWYTESKKSGREQLKNMFYDEETDTVGVTDIGEYLGSEDIDEAELPDHGVGAPYA